jgi:hypothetical protein
MVQHERASIKNFFSHSIQKNGTICDLRGDFDACGHSRIGTDYLFKIPHHKVKSDSWSPDGRRIGPIVYPTRTSLRHRRSAFPGNGILRGRDSGVQKAHHVQLMVSRDKAPLENPPIRREALLGDLFHAIRRFRAISAAQC